MVLVCKTITQSFLLRKEQKRAKGMIVNTVKSANKTHISSEFLECCGHFFKVTIFCCFSIYTISVDTRHKVMKHGCGYNPIVLHLPSHNSYSCYGCLGKVRTAWSMTGKRIQTTVHKHAIAFNAASKVSPASP